MDAGDKKKVIIITVAAIAIAVIIAVAAVIIINNNSHNNSDPYEKVTYTVDEDDLKSFNAEETNRSCIGKDYDKKAKLFMDKALADDDRDKDGNSTLQSCIDSLKKECPSDMSFQEFLLKYLQKKFTYVQDAEQYGIPDWAVYPTEMLSSKKGDCEDYAILSAAILNRAGYDCGIAVFHNHAVALVQATTTYPKRLKDTIRSPYNMMGGHTTSWTDPSTAPWAIPTTITHRTTLRQPYSLDI